MRRKSKIKCLLLVILFNIQSRHRLNQRNNLLTKSWFFYKTCSVSKSSRGRTVEVKRGTFRNPVEGAPLRLTRGTNWTSLLRFETFGGFFVTLTGSFRITSQLLESVVRPVSATSVEKNFWVLQPWIDDQRLQVLVTFSWAEELVGITISCMHGKGKKM